VRNSVSLIQIVGLWIRSRILRDPIARWNYQYAVGKWDKLKNEQPRIAATALLLTRHVRPGRVLEIGCGEALLQQQLDPADYLGWVGVDISDVAIQRAQAFANENVRYLLADMETLDPGGKFGAIVFTESIYYAADCARLLERYSRFLNPGGVFIISICRTKRSDKIWADIHSVTTVIDTVVTRDDTITDSELNTWDCEVLAPRGRAMAD